MIMITDASNRSWFLCLESNDSALDWGKAISIALTGTYFTGCIQSIPSLLSVTPSYLNSKGPTHEDAEEECNTTSITKRVESFILFFIKSTAMELQGMSLGCKLQDSGIRSLCWRYYLGQFNTVGMSLDSWVQLIKEDREEYSRLKIKYIQSRSSSNLSNHILGDIRKDLSRTHCGEVIFQDPALCILTTNILTIMALSDEKLSYKQGMLEILAIILILLRTECTGMYSTRESKDSNGGGPQLACYDANYLSCCTTNKSTIKDGLMDIFNADYLEHDAYTLMKLVFSKVSYLYTPPAPRSIGKVVEETDMGTNEHTYDTGGTAILDILNRVQNEITRKYDPDLWVHLQVPYNI